MRHFCSWKGSKWGFSLMIFPQRLLYLLIYPQKQMDKKKVRSPMPHRSFVFASWPTASSGGVGAGGGQWRRPHPGRTRAPSHRPLPIPGVPLKDALFELLLTVLQMSKRIHWFEWGQFAFFILARNYSDPCISLEIDIIKKYDARGHCNGKSKSSLIYEFYICTDFVQQIIFISDLNLFSLMVILKHF